MSAKNHVRNQEGKDSDLGEKEGDDCTEKILDAIQTGVSFRSFVVITRCCIPLASGYFVVWGMHFVAFINGRVIMVMLARHLLTSFTWNIFVWTLESIAHCLKITQIVSFKIREIDVCEARFARNVVEEWDFLSDFQTQWNIVKYVVKFLKNDLKNLSCTYYYEGGTTRKENATGKWNCEEDV